MGFMNPPRPPSEDPELKRQREAEQKRLEEEERSCCIDKTANHQRNRKKTIL